MTWFGFAVISAFFSSLSAIIEKRSLSHIHALDFSIALSFFVALLSLPMLYRAPWEQATPPVIGLVLGVSILGAFAFIGVTRGLRHLEISTSSSLFLIGPFITALLGFAFLGESLSGVQFVGMLLLALGTYVLETKHLAHAGEFWHALTKDRYTLYTLFGLLLYGFSALGDRIVLSRYGVEPRFYTALMQLFLALQFFFIALYYRGGIGSITTLARREWQMFALIALLTTLYRLAQAHATALAAVGLVVAVKRSSALFTTVIGGELFREHDLIRKSVACLIMIVGVYLLAV